MPVGKTYDWNQISNKWSSAMGSPNAQANYKAGIMRQTVSPTALAATPEAQAKYMQGVADSVSSGRRDRALMSVTLADHQNASINKGAPRLGTGATAAAPKYARKMAPYTQVYANIASQLATMPKGGLSNAIARAQVAISALMAAAGKS